VNQFGSGYRPLHLVNSTTNTSKIIRTLCEHEVNVEAPNKFRGTPLRMAIQWRWLENIKELLRCGASLEEASDGWKQDTQWGKTEQNKFNESLKTANVQQAIKDGNELFYINECKSSPCKNGGTCTTSDGSYLCSCQDGWTGNNCNQDINECNSGPCKNGGTCANSDGSYSCSCRVGWTGNNCNQDVNECDTSTHNCDSSADCSNSEGSFTCSCKAGYTGDGTTGNCAENYITLTNDVGTAFATNEHSGAHNATKAFKMQDIGDDAYWATKRNPPTPVFLWFQFKDPQRVITIKFKEKYALPVGKEYEVFASNDFGNCGNQENQKIIFSGSENLFAAGAGFENQLYFYCYGLKISHKRYNWWFGLSQLQFEVEDGNECAANSHNCDLNAHCFITMGSLQCFCKAGYTGDGTTGNCADVNECDLSTHNCDLNADCSNSVGSFACSCRAGYTGDGTTGNCADINECNGDPCKNGGVCTNSDGSYSCSCQDGWTGINCNQDINECDNSPCKNGGTCSNSPGNYTCKCQDGWIGYNCGLTWSNILGDCIESSDQDGWIFLQRRDVQTTSNDDNIFARMKWIDYKAGFEESGNAFWLGLQEMHEKTSSGRWKVALVFDCWRLLGYSKCAVFNDFKVDGENEKFKLHVGAEVSRYGFRSGQTLDWNNNMAFTTSDSDNDDFHNGNCAEFRLGGWWMGRRGAGTGCAWYCPNCKYGCNFAKDSDCKNSCTGTYMAMKRI